METIKLKSLNYNKIKNFKIYQYKSSNILIPSFPLSMDAKEDIDELWRRDPDITLATESELYNPLYGPVCHRQSPEWSTLSVKKSFQKELAHVKREINFGLEILKSCFPSFYRYKFNLINLENKHLSLNANHIWATAWQNQQNDCAPSEDSDQPGHLPSLIRVFAVRSMGS